MRWKVSGTRKSRECWRSPKRRRRTRFSRRKRICERCWSRRGVKRRRHGERYERELRGPGTNLYGWKRGGVGGAGSERGDLCGVRRRATRMEEHVHGSGRTTAGMEDTASVDENRTRAHGADV